MPTAVTQGIRVTVESQYLPERSITHRGRYAFAYKVKIENVGRVTAQLRAGTGSSPTAMGAPRRVRGDGVVGAQADAAPGRALRVTPAGAMLSTSFGRTNARAPISDDGVR